MMKEILGGGKFVHYTLTAPRAAAEEKVKFAHFVGFFLGPGNREPSWIDSSLPACRNRSGNSTT